jgi:hypothetical protein
MGPGTCKSDVRPVKELLPRAERRCGGLLVPAALTRHKGLGRGGGHAAREKLVLVAGGA